MVTKIFGFLGESNEKVVKKLQPLVKEINSLEREWERLSEDGLKAKTQELRAAIQRGPDLEETWTTSCRRPSPASGRRPSAPWASATSMSSSWGA